MFFSEVSLGISFLFLLIFFSIFWGWDGFSNAVYAMFITSVSYMFLEKEMSVCSFIMDCSAKHKALAVDVIFWFFIVLIIIIGIHSLIKKHTERA